jgi:hypothetical protein
MLISNKTYFKLKLIGEDKESHYIYIDKVNNPSRKYNSCKYIGTE